MTSVGSKPALLSNEVRDLLGVTTFLRDPKQRRIYEIVLRLEHEVERLGDYWQGSSDLRDAEKALLWFWERYKRDGGQWIPEEFGAIIRRAERR